MTRSRPKHLFVFTIYVYISFIFFISCLWGLFGRWDMSFRLQLCASCTLIGAKALVLAGWFAHKTFTAHARTQRQSGPRFHSLLFLMLLEARSCFVRLAGWTQRGEGREVGGWVSSELVSFQPRSQSPATAALWVSFCLFCTTGPGAPEEDCEKSTWCQMCSGLERVQPACVCVEQAKLAFFNLKQLDSACLPLQKKKIWFEKTQNHWSYQCENGLVLAHLASLQVVIPKH